MKNARYFKLKYADGRIEVAKGRDDEDIIRRYNLTSSENADTRLFELFGEQLAIARANNESDDD